MKASRIVFVFAFLAGAFAAARLPAEDARPPCCRERLPAAPPTDKSLYLLESVWTSDFDKTMKLGVMRGRPVVLVLFFAQCEFACPITVHDLQRIEAALPAATRGAVDFALVSIDSERDSVAALHAYRRKQGLPVANWLLLRGADDDVRELAALLGVNYRRDARGQFAHSNLITVLNAEGEVVFQQSGLNQSPDRVVTALQAAVAGLAAAKKPEGAH